MSKHFTQEEILTLRSNNNVLQVSDCQIRFTPEFKQRAFEQYMNGVPVKQIFQENGIDPKILGDSRIYSFTNHLKNKAVNDQSFSDFRKNNRFKKPPLSSEQEYLQQLENQVAYLTQEVEFLKKNLKADMEARRRWELQHLHTLSSN